MKKNFPRSAAVIRILYLLKKGDILKAPSSSTQIFGVGGEE